MELKKCCEYCEFYEYEYKYKCADCRGEDQQVNHSNFEISKELLKWKKEDYMALCISITVN